MMLATTAANSLPFFLQDYFFLQYDDSSEAIRYKEQTEISYLT